MTWVKLDDLMPEHPKIIGRSDAAFRALIELWCYSARHKTNGKIEKPAIKRIVKPRVLAELIESGLLHENGVAFDIHDWLDHNISLEDHESKKAASAERKRRWREAHRNDDGTFHE